MNLNNIISFRKTLSVSVSIISILLISLTLFTFIALAQSTKSPAPNRIIINGFNPASANNYYINDNTPTFQVQGLTAGSSIRLTVSGINYSGIVNGASTTHNFNISQLSDGEHKYFATQNLAGKSSTDRSDQFPSGTGGTVTIDTVAPEPSASVSISGSTATVNVTGLDADEETWKWRRQTGTNPKTYTDFSDNVAGDGSFTTTTAAIYQIVATDLATNTTTITANVSFDSSVENPVESITYSSGVVTHENIKYLNISHQGVADTLSVVLAFPENVSGDLKVQFKNGEENLGSVVTVSEPANGNTYTATYTVVAGHNVANNAFGYDITNESDIIDDAGNALAETSTTILENVIVDTTKPNNPNKSITLGPDSDSAKVYPDKTYLNAGDEISAVVEFDENVSGNLKVLFRNGSTNLGGGSPIIATRDGNTYTATYIFGSGGRDLNVVYNSLNYIITNESEIIDIAGNALAEQGQTNPNSPLIYDSQIPSAPSVKTY